MNKMILPGIPSEPDPNAGIALPLMRGFSCPVVAPFMGGQDGPPEGVGFGWSNVVGKGVVFFVTVHAEGGFALSAQLNYAHYQRAAQLFAGIGQQALLNGHLDDVGEDDPLAALAVAHEALGCAASCLGQAAAGSATQSDIEVWAEDARDAQAKIAKALRLEPKDEINGK